MQLFFQIMKLPKCKELIQYSSIFINNFILLRMKTLIGVKPWIMLRLRSNNFQLLRKIWRKLWANLESSQRIILRVLLIILPLYKGSSSVNLWIQMAKFVIMVSSVSSEISNVFQKLKTRTLGIKVVYLKRSVFLIRFLI